MRVGFAGAGNMAAAIARGWAGATGGPDSMLFCDLDRVRAQALAEETGGEAREALAELAADCDVLLLAVKPAALDAVAEELAGKAPPILSVLAATPLARLNDAFPGVPVLRVMPNQPVQVRRGVLCYATPTIEDGALAQRMIDLLSLLGASVELPEEQLEAAMAVMSCSPAYVARFAGELAAAGEREGLAATASAELVRETFAGTAELLRVKESQAIVTAVAPPGGATEAGLQALSKGGFETAIEAAVEASLERFR